MTLLLREIPKFSDLEARSRRYPELDPSAVATCFALLRVASDVLEAAEANLARHGISQGRFSVLIGLDREPENGMSACDLARRTGVTRATMTGLLDGLQRDGLLSREQDPDDRRAVVVRLTGKGRRFLTALLPEHYRRIAALMAELGPTERKALVRLLEKVSVGLPRFAVSERGSLPTLKGTGGQ